MFYNVSPKIAIFHELLIVETCNKCHWIWHASNPKYACHLSNFDAFFPVKINKMWNFGCFLNSPWQKTEKKPHQFAQMKKCLQRLANLCTYRFLGMLIAMHYVRTLCDKYFLSYYGFSTFCMGRSRYWVMNHVVGIKWDTRRDCCIHPIRFSWFWTSFSTMCLLKLSFFMNCLL